MWRSRLPGFQRNTTTKSMKLWENRYFCVLSSIHESKEKGFLECNGTTTSVFTSICNVCTKQTRHNAFICHFTVWVSHKLCPFCVWCDVWLLTSHSQTQHFMLTTDIFFRFGSFDLWFWYFVCFGYIWFVHVEGSKNMANREKM